MKLIKGKQIYRTIMLILVVALLTFIVTTVIMHNKFYSKEEYGNVNYIFNNKINNIREVLENEYLGEIDDQKLIEGAIKGYLEGLGDEYTEYFTKSEMDEFKMETDGDFVGIGIYMLQDTEKNEIVVLAPIKDSPAEKAGIESGDIIKKVDGKEYTGEDFEKVASEIKGKEGTTVKIGVERNNKTLTFEIERKKIDLYPVESEILEGNIGYINLPSFDSGVSEEFKNEYNKLKKKKIKSLIIDLRNNGGGIVDETLEIADYILDKGSTIITTVDKNGNETVEKSKSNPIIKIPIVVLVNENTASSSEIFAAALKENNKATILGTTTYGKGLIQELLTLKDGSGIKITIEEYFTPNKNKINKIGIEPDIKVELPTNIDNIYSIERKDDTQLRRAVDVLKEN